jgi:hypothetical protein
MINLAFVEKNEGYFSPFSGIIALTSKVRPMIALAFSGSPGTSAFMSAIVIVKKRTAMLSGL